MRRPFGCIFGLTFWTDKRYNISFKSNESRRGERMIQLLIEPSYGANLWAQAYLAGIREEARKRGWELRTLTEEAEAVSAVEQTVARVVRAEALKEEETETVSAAEQTVVREARADALKAEEAEITVSEDRTAEVRADSVRDRKEVVLLIPYSHRS